MLINFLDISNFLEIVNIQDLIKEIADNLNNDTTNNELLESLENYFIRKDKNSSPTQDIQFNLGDETHRWKNIYAETFTGTAVSAEYADLAEKYSIKEKVNPGDVIVISEDPNYEGEFSKEIASNKIIGVVSENPGLQINSKEDGEFIALKGKVKCKVFGTVTKGDPLISYFDGGAISINNELYDLKNLNMIGKTIIGIALESVENPINKISYIKIVI